jgi:hypothetical protein
MEDRMRARKNEGPGPEVTARFHDGVTRFPLSAGDTIGDLASQLARLAAQRGALLLTIDLTFPRAEKPVLH